MLDVTARLLLAVRNKNLSLKWHGKWKKFVDSYKWKRSTGCRNSLSGVLTSLLCNCLDSVSLTWWLSFRLAFITMTKTRTFHTLCLPEEERVSISQPPNKILGLTLTESTWVTRPPLNQSQFNSVHSLSYVQLFATPWIAARQASLSITNSWSSLNLTSIESVMPSSHLILCRPLLLPQSLLASESFPMSQLFAWGGQITGVSALASFLPTNSQDQSQQKYNTMFSMLRLGLCDHLWNKHVQK